jgi:hypothetical protein
VVESGEQQRAPAFDAVADATQLAVFGIARAATRRALGDGRR